MKCKDCHKYYCERRSDGEAECFYESELQECKEVEEKTYWQTFRNHAAKDILSNALIPYALKEFGEEKISTDYWTDKAIEWADCLISKLKEKEE